MEDFKWTKKTKLMVIVCVIFCASCLILHVSLDNYRTTETKIYHFEETERYLVIEYTKNGFGEILYEESYWLVEPEPKA